MNQGLVIQGSFLRGLPGTVRLPLQLTHMPSYGGLPLPPDVLQRMERHFGTSFRDVRVHVGPHAAQLGARAFTTGSRIHFAPGQYDPATAQGQQVLAHELTHVVQQRSGRVRNPFGMSPAIVHDRGLEMEAERNSRAFSIMQPEATVQMTAHRPLVRRAVRRQWGDRSRSGRARYRAAGIPLNVRELGNRLKAAYLAAEGTASRGGNYIYLGMTQGGASYVGITNNPEARQAEHGERHHLRVLNRMQPLTRIEVRGIEQATINMTRGSARNQNIANSIAATQPYYDAAIRFGAAFISWITREYGADIHLEI